MQTQFLTLQEEVELDSVTHASLDGEKYYPVVFVGLGNESKFPYICKRTDLKRSALKEYKFVKGTRSKYYTVVEGKKYLLVEV